MKEEEDGERERKESVRRDCDERQQREKQREIERKRREMVCGLY